MENLHMIIIPGNSRYSLSYAYVNIWIIYQRNIEWWSPEQEGATGEYITQLFLTNVYPQIPLLILFFSPASPSLLSNTKLYWTLRLLNPSCTWLLELRQNLGGGRSALPLKNSKIGLKTILSKFAIVCITSK